MIETIFGYPMDELKGMNINQLMPRVIAKQHRSFMQRYYETGEKRILDRPFRSYGKDRNNSIIALNGYLKMLPVLTDCILYCGIIQKEESEDMVICDLQNVYRFLLWKI